MAWSLHSPFTTGLPGLEGSRVAVHNIGKTRIVLRRLVFAFLPCGWMSLGARPGLELAFIGKAEVVVVPGSSASHLEFNLAHGSNCLISKE